MTQELSFEITSDGGVKKALEELFYSDGVRTIYIEKDNGELFPVANVERHPDCPKHIYEAWIRSLIQYDNSRSKRGTDSL
jgi:hypothetical protein